MSSSNLFNVSLQASQSQNFVLRPNGGKLILQNFNASTNTADRMTGIPMGTAVTFTRGCTVSGGTWFTPAVAQGSIIQTNSTGTIDATHYSQIAAFTFKQDMTNNFNPDNSIVVENQEILLVQVSELASGYTAVNLNFLQVPLVEEIPEINSE